MPKDFIPHREDVFHNWQDNYMTVVTASAVSWGVPPGDVAALQGLQTAYVNQYQVGSKEQKLSRTAGQAKAFRDSWDDYVAQIRKFTAQWITSNPAVSDAQKTDAGVTVPDTTPTRINAVNFAPQLVIEGIKVGEHILRFSNPQDPNSKAMPLGQKIILRSAVAAANVAEDQIPWSGTKTVKRFLFTVAFNPSDKSKTAYYTACYESDRGERGPFSSVIEGVVA